MKGLFTALDRILHIPFNLEGYNITFANVFFYTLLVMVILIVLRIAFWND